MHDGDEKEYRGFIGLCVGIGFLLAVIYNTIR